MANRARQCRTSRVSKPRIARVNLDERRMHRSEIIRMSMQISSMDHKDMAQGGGPAYLRARLRQAARGGVLRWGPNAWRTPVTRPASAPPQMDAASANGCCIRKWMLQPSARRLSAKDGQRVPEKGKESRKRGRTCLRPPRVFFACSRPARHTPSQYRASHSERLGAYAGIRCSSTMAIPAYNMSVPCQYRTLYRSAVCGKRTPATSVYVGTRDRVGE
eukprot:3756225-Rhodomonas_salina.4